MKHIVHIQGRRWFQRTYGNTYHSVTVHVDGEHVFSSGKAYGYGDQYQQTAWEWLDKNTFIRQPQVKPEWDGRKQHENGSSEPPWQWAERTGNTVINTVSDVARERDL